MGIQQDIETLAKSLRKNGLATNDIDAMKMAERMLGVSKSSEQRFQWRKEAPAPKVVEKPVFEEKPFVQVKEKPEEPLSVEVEEKPEEPLPIRLEEIEPVQKPEIPKNSNTENEPDEELECGFKEVPVEKKEKPALTKEEKNKTDLSKLFYYGNK